MPQHGGGVQTMSAARRWLAGCFACGFAAGCAVLPTWAPSTSTSTSEKPVAPEAGDARQLAPDQTAKIQMALAEEMRKKGDRAGAIVQYEKARANDPSLDGHVSHRLGVLYDELGEQARALVEFQRRLKSTPRDAGLLSDLGYCYYGRGEWAESEKYLRQALDVDGRNPLPATTWAWRWLSRENATRRWRRSARWSVRPKLSRTSASSC